MRRALFPWRRLLASADLATLDHVVVVENTAIPKIAAIYARTPVDTPAGPGRPFHLADAAAPYLSQRFVAANFGFHSKTMNGVAEQPERWKRAVRLRSTAPWDRRSAGFMWHAIFRPKPKRRSTIWWRTCGSALKERIAGARLDEPADQAFKALDKPARLDVKLRLPGQVARLSWPWKCDATTCSGDTQSATRRFAWRRQVNRFQCARSTATTGTINLQTVNA